METIEVLHKKKVLNPKLRFKEFSDDWKIDSLTNLYSEIVVGFVGTVSSDYCDEKEGVQFVRTLNVKDGWFSKEGLQYVSKTFHLKNKKSQVKNGDILIARVGANMGLVCEINGLIGEANSANVIIIKNQTNLSSRFYASYLSSSKGQKQIQSKGAGGAQEVLNISVAKTINVPFLSLPEQQKIASFLSAVDKKIQQLTRKKELLEQYKKGVMQQLFSGKLRFKDENGKSFPKWEEKEIGDIFENHGGTSLEEFTDEKSDYKFISIGNYSKEGVFIDNGQRIGLNDKSKTKLLKKDELVMVLNDKTKSGDIIGSSILIDKDDTYIYNQRSERLICKPSILPKFAWVYLNYKMFRKNVFAISQGGTQIYVNFPMVKKIKIMLPLIAEQTKIFELILSVNNKIEIVNKQITQTQTFKKGLLQQMFV
jgi:type I restriction enzyme S subunit